MIKKFSGHLSKMHAVPNSPIQYYLPQSTPFLINDLIGKSIQITFSGDINCIACKRKIKKSFQQGYCYPCTKRLAQCDLCIMQPTRCHYFQGTCREPEWGLKHCMIPHWVYLSFTSNVKVGITRAYQAQTRWIDQGAITATPLYLVKSRRHSGFVEAAFSKIISDRTQWQKMLKMRNEEVDLLSLKPQLIEQMKSNIELLSQQFEPGAIQAVQDQTLYRFNFPLNETPTRITSYNLDKTPHIHDVLIGIKGQYLIFENGVFNVRKFSGYHVDILIEN